MNATTANGFITLQQTTANVKLGVLNAGAAGIDLTAVGTITDGNNGSGDPNLTAADGATLTTTGLNSAIGKEYTYSDLAIGPARDELTSAALPFSAADVYKVINITGGTGFTPGSYTILSVAGDVATMSSAVGVVGSTGGSGTSGDPIRTAIGALTATTYDGGVYIADSNGPGMIINSILAPGAGLQSIPRRQQSGRP